MQTIPVMMIQPGTVLDIRGETVAIIHDFQKDETMEELLQELAIKTRARVGWRRHRCNGHEGCEILFLGEDPSVRKSIIKALEQALPIDGIDEITAFPTAIFQTLDMGEVAKGYAGID